MTGIAGNTVQQAYRGRWRNVCGAPTDEGAMAEYVAAAIARDGYQSFRIADAATDGENGAPMRPVHAFVPLPAAEMREWLNLLARDADGDVLTETERDRIAILTDGMQGEVIGASDDHAVAQAMRRTYDAERRRPSPADAE